MKKMFLALPLLFAASFSSAHAAAAPVQPAPAQAVATAPAAPAKQVHIAVGRFECGAPQCDSQAATGIGEALTNALMESGRFAIYERSGLGAGLQEGLIGGADSGQVQGADVLVMGTITAYGEDSSGGNGCFMGVCLGAKEERVVVNLRIFDVKTSRIIGATQVEGKNSANSASLNISGLNLGGKQSSGMNKAVSAMLTDAVQKLSATIPASYYR